MGQLNSLVGEKVPCKVGFATKAQRHKGSQRFLGFYPTECGWHCLNRNSNKYPSNGTQCPVKTVPFHSGYLFVGFEPIERTKELLRFLPRAYLLFKL